MIASTSADTTVERGDEELAEADSQMMLVALIGPDSESRSFMARALAAPESRVVHEFSSYPELRLEILQMLSEHFDFLMIDLDSDEEFALHLVEMLTAMSAPAVMVYSRREDRALMEKAAAAGARDFFPLPVDMHGATDGNAPPPIAGTPAASVVTAEPDVAIPPASPAATVPQRAVEPAQRYPDSVSVQEIRRTNRLETAEREVIPRRIDYGITEVSRNDGVVPLRPATEFSVSAPASNPEDRKQDRTLAKAPVEATAAVEILRPMMLPPSPPSQPSVPPRREIPTDSQSGVTTPLAPHAGGLETDEGVLHLARQIREAKASDTPAKTTRVKAAQYEQEPESDEIESPDWKRRGLVAAGPVAMVLVFAFFFLHSPRKSAVPMRSPAQPVVSQPQSQQPAPAAATDRAAAPVAVAKDPAGAKPPVVDPPSVDPEPAQPAYPGRLPARSMAVQFTAPSKIASGSSRPEVADAAPSTLALGGLYGGGVPGAVLSGGHKVNVQPEVANVSAGVAAGMLVHKTAPIYPPLAKQGHLSGTVVLKASITKEGKIAGLRVISGVPIFSGAAMDAVKSWRYKPYMLDNRPVEVETTISVVFSDENH